MENDGFELDMHLSAIEPDFYSIIALFIGLESIIKNIVVNPNTGAAYGSIVVYTSAKAKCLAA